MNIQYFVKNNKSLTNERCYILQWILINCRTNPLRLTMQQFNPHKHAYLYSSMWKTWLLCGKTKRQGRRDYPCVLLDASQVHQICTFYSTKTRITTHKGPHASTQTMRNRANTHYLYKCEKLWARPTLRASFYTYSAGYRPFSQQIFWLVTILAQVLLITPPF